jgi:hypothetical protein
MAPTPPKEDDSGYWGCCKSSSFPPILLRSELIYQLTSSQSKTEPTQSSYYGSYGPKDARYPGYLVEQETPSTSAEVARERLILGCGNRLHSIIKIGSSMNNSIV